MAPFTSSTPVSCSNPVDEYQFVSEWNLITSPISCTSLSPPTINAPYPNGFLPSGPPPSCYSGNWCANLEAVDEYGPGCIRGDTQNMIASYILFEGSLEDTPPHEFAIGSFCECMNYCGTLSQCQAVEIVFAYQYDVDGNMVWWCNL